MGNSSMALCHYITSVNIKKFSRLVDCITREDPAGECIILMADCDPDVFMKHM